MEYSVIERVLYRNKNVDRVVPIENTVLNELNIETGNNVETVQVHYGPYADELTRSLHTLALTVGADIYFRSKVYKPETEEGRKVLAHELTHVQQSKEDRLEGQRPVVELEKEAEIQKIQAEADLQEANRLLALAEDVATERNISLAKTAGCQLHVAHVSTANSIYAIREAKDEANFIGGGFSITCEVTPHHLALNAETDDNLKLIVNPPLRSEVDRQALLQAFSDGTVDVISTDHAPHTLEDKQNGAPGFSGLETSFAVAHTELVETGVISIDGLKDMPVIPLDPSIWDGSFADKFAMTDAQERYCVADDKLELSATFSVDLPRFVVITTTPFAARAP